MAKKGSKNLSKSLGIIGKVVNVIPDTTELVKESLNTVAPLVEKAQEQHYKNQGQQEQADDVVDMFLEEGKAFLENKGFSAAGLLATADKKFADKQPKQIVAMSPKPGALKKESLIKLYYVDEAVLEKSKILAEKSQQSKEETLKKFSTNPFKKKKLSD